MVEILHKKSKIKDNPIDTEQEKKEQELDTPSYMSQLKLTEDQEESIKKEIEAEIKAIEKDQGNYASNCDKIDRLLAGETDVVQMSIYKATSSDAKYIMKTIVRAILDGIFNNSPIFTFTPTPMTAQKENGILVATKQQDFIDDKLEETVDLETPLENVLYDATKYDHAFLKMEDRISVKKRVVKETYKAERISLGYKKTHNNPNFQYEEQFEYRGAEKFLKNFPIALEDPEEEAERQKNLKKLRDGKDVNIEVEKEEVTYNDPYFSAVEGKNFLCRKECTTYEKLAEQKLYGELEDYTYHQLKECEKRGLFADVDKILRKDQKEGESLVDVKKRYADKTFTIRHLTGLFFIGEEEVKLIVEQDVETKEIIGAMYYPFDAIDCQYVPFRLKNEKKTLYNQSSVLDDISKDHQIKDVLTNLLLEALAYHIKITPICNRKSHIASQFLNNNFVPGLPLMKEENEPDPSFLQKFLPPLDVSGTMALLQYFSKSIADKTGVSDMMSGTPSKYDPSAPGNKTAMLLQQAGVNLMDYAKHIVKSLNKVPGMMLQLYYQKDEDGYTYKMNADKIVGGNIFEEITRDELIAKTNVTIRTLLFHHERRRRKEESTALYSVLRQDPLMTLNPEGIFYITRKMVESYGDEWRMEINRILPTSEQLQQKRIQIAMQAVAMTLEQSQINSNSTADQNTLMLMGIMDLLTKQAMGGLSDTEQNQLEELTNEGQSKQ